LPQVRRRGKGCVCHKEWWKVEGDRGALRRSKPRGLGRSYGGFECENVKKLKMTEPFLGDGGLIWDGE